MRDRPHPAEELVGGGRAARVRIVAGAAALGAALALGHALGLDDRARALLEVARGAGPAGIAVHVAAYLAAALLALPLAPLTVAAGAAWGPAAGAALAVPAVALASSCAFLAGRLAVRDPAALARGDGRVARAARAAGAGGVRLVLLLRLAPLVPFSILNFVFGATPTRLGHFALGSVLGTIPSQVGYALLGAVLAWPRGTARTLAEAGLVAGAAALSLAATWGVVALLRRGAAPPPPPGD